MRMKEPIKNSDLFKCWLQKRRKRIEFMERFFDHVDKVVITRRENFKIKNMNTKKNLNYNGFRFLSVKLL